MHLACQCLLATVIRRLSVSAERCCYSGKSRPCSDMFRLLWPHCDTLGEFSAVADHAALRIPDLIMIPATSQSTILPAIPCRLRTTTNCLSMCSRLLGNGLFFVSPNTCMFPISTSTYWAAWRTYAGLVYVLVQAGDVEASHARIYIGC